MQVVVLHGSPGSGKTTVATVMAERLRQDDVTMALIDVDAFAIVNPYQGTPFTRANLRAVWPNYAAIPDIKVIVPLVVVDLDDLRTLREIMLAESFTVCELTAPRNVLEQRVLEREPNEFWQQRLLDFVALYHARTDHETIRDFQVSTHDRSIDASVDDVLRGCGWRTVSP